VRRCGRLADDEKDDDDAGYIETLLVVPLCSVTILEEDRDMRCLKQEVAGEQPELHGA
jgi:hypothetical protein